MLVMNSKLHISRAFVLGSIFFAIFPANGQSSNPENRKALVRKLFSAKFETELRREIETVTTDLDTFAKVTANRLMVSVNPTNSLAALLSESPTWSKTYTVPFTNVVHATVEELVESINVGKSGLRPLVRRLLTVQVRRAFLDHATGRLLPKFNRADLKLNLKEFDDITKKAFAATQRTAQLHPGPMSPENFDRIFREKYREEASKWMINEISTRWLGEEYDWDIDRSIDPITKNLRSEIDKRLDNTIGNEVSIDYQPIVTEFVRNIADDVLVELGYPVRKPSRKAFEDAMGKRIQLDRNQLNDVRQERIAAKETENEEPIEVPPGGSEDGTTQNTRTLAGRGNPSSGNEEINLWSGGVNQVARKTSSSKSVSFSFLLELRMKERRSSVALLTLHSWPGGKSKNRNPNRDKEANIWENEFQIAVKGFTEDQVQEAADQIRVYLESSDGINRCFDVSHSKMDIDPDTGQLPNVQINCFLAIRSQIFGPAFPSAFTQAIETASSGFSGGVISYLGYFQQNSDQTSFQYHAN